MTHVQPQPLDQARDLARRFAQEEIAPVSEYWDQMGEPREFPRELYRRMGELGLIGYSSPTDFGGGGHPQADFVAIIEELAYVDVAFAVMCGIPRLFAIPVLAYGSDALKEKYVGPCLRAETIGVFALSEPGAGSDAANLQTIARERGDHYLVSGEKTFITHGDAADVALVFGKIEGADRVSAFVVDADQPGWQPSILQRKMGIRATTTARILLDEVRVPRENLVGEAGQGFRYAMATLDCARVSVAAQAMGLTWRALDEACAYALRREAFGKPLAARQAIQWMIADMATRLEAARLLTARAARKQESGEPFAVEASMAKLSASETARFAVDRAMQIYGGYGYIGEYSVIEKLYRDQRFLEIGEGTSEVQRLIISRNVLEAARRRGSRSR